MKRPPSERETLELVEKLVANRKRLPGQAHIAALHVACNALRALQRAACVAVGLGVDATLWRHKFCEDRLVVSVPAMQRSMTRIATLEAVEQPCLDPLGPLRQDAARRL